MLYLSAGLKSDRLLGKEKLMGSESEVSPKNILEIQLRIT
jgi:hypothetical protein